MTRRLLPILFAVVALMLCAHQASATGHLDDIEHRGFHMSDVQSQDLHHPLHSTSCCVLSFGVAAQGFAGNFYGDHRPKYAFDAGALPPSSQRREKHFRPPRLA